MRYRPKIKVVEAIRVKEHDVILTPSGYRPVFPGDWIVMNVFDDRLILSNHEFEILFEKCPDDKTPTVGHNRPHVLPETDRTDRDLPPCNP